MEIRSTKCRVARAAWALVLCLAGLTAHAAERLVFLNWSDNMDPELLSEFTAETGIEVEQVYFASDTDRDALIAQSEGGEYDLVLVSGDRLSSLMRWNWLARISEEDVPNMRHVDERWTETFPEAAGYSAPLVWGTTGIAYRSDLVDEDISHWSQLFDPGASFCGHLWMFRDHRENIELALASLGFDRFDPTSEQLDAAKERLLAQIDCVANYDYPDVNEKSQLISGEVAVAPLYNGDAEYMRDIEPAIRFVVPDEDPKVWADFIVVPRTSTRQPAALAFIDFLHRPEIAARIAEYLNCAPSNTAALQHLPVSMLDNPAIFPPPGTLDGGALERPKSARTVRRFNAISMEIEAARRSAR